jgi:Flp pilus assembly pilin Flp
MWLTAPQPSRRISAAMIAHSLLRFWRDRRGGTLADYALVVALLVSMHRFGVIPGAALASAIGPLFSA